MRVDSLVVAGADWVSATGLVRRILEEGWERFRAGGGVAGSMVWECELCASGGGAESAGEGVSEVTGSGRGAVASETSHRKVFGSGVWVSGLKGD